MAKTGGLMRRTGGVLAAYLLVLQAVLAGLALGAAPASADPFTVLCAAAAAAASDEAPASDQQHKALPNCCVAGCGLHLVGIAPPDVRPAPEAARLVDVGAPRRARALAPPSEDHSPRNPRAPPALG